MDWYSPESFKVNHIIHKKETWNLRFYATDRDEAEDVQEEDLDYHGNGWFRWEKKGKILREYATMSMRDVPILREYKVKVSACDSLIYYEPKYKKRIYRFSKVGN